MFSVRSSKKNKLENKRLTTAQSVIRGYFCRRQFKLLKRRKIYGCITMQRYFRGFLQRKRLAKQQKYIVKVQAVFRGQSFRRRLCTGDAMEIPISYFKQFRESNMKRGLHMFVSSIDHSDTGYLMMEDIYEMVTKFLPNPMPHKTAKIFLSLIQSSLLKGTKNGLYSIRRIVNVIMAYKVKNIPFQLHNTKFDKRPSILTELKNRDNYKERQIDMTAIPPYLVVSKFSAPMHDIETEETEAQIRLPANTSPRDLVTRMNQKQQQQQQQQQKNDVKHQLLLSIDTQDNKRAQPPESPGTINDNRSPSPPKTIRSPKARQKTYLYVWEKVLSSDGINYYYYNTFTKQSQWKQPARGIINKYVDTNRSSSQFYLRGSEEIRKNTAVQKAPQNHKQLIENTTKRKAKLPTRKKVNTKKDVTTRTETHIKQKNKIKLKLRSGNSKPDNENVNGKELENNIKYSDKKEIMEVNTNEDTKEEMVKIKTGKGEMNKKTEPIQVASISNNYDAETLTKDRGKNVPFEGKMAWEELDQETENLSKIGDMYKDEKTRQDAEKLRHEREKNMDNAEKYSPMEEKEELDAFLECIWQEYDADESGSIDPEETKKMIENITGKKVSLHECKNFLLSIDTNGDMLIQREELSAYIYKGVKLSAVARENFKNRGPLQTTMIEFFDGIDRERIKFRQKLENEHYVRYLI
jgi:hypothetical protein